MDWTAQFDGYCERTDLSYWAEPVNAVTNAAFVLMALYMWRRTAGVPMARVLCAILCAIGVGSYLFHTHATAWAALSDVAPIGLFILTYLFLVHRDVVGMRAGWAGLATLGFLPYAALVVPLFNALPFFRISNFYWSVPVLLFAYGFALRRRMPETARGLVLGGGLLCLSITLRSVDEMVCGALPLGTHFLWHILNAIMLAWMIEVYRRHVLRG